MQKVKKAVIMAAGFGSRFLPFAKAVSKTMLPIIDTPTIQIIAQEALDSGIEEILVIVGINKDAIISHFSTNKKLEEKYQNRPEMLESIKKPASMHLSFVEQKVINGTGGAILLAEEWVNNEPFLLMFADDLMYNDGVPVSKQLINAYEETGKYALAVKSVPVEDVSKYSIIKFSQKSGKIMNVEKIIEKPKYEDIQSTFATFGRYLLLPDIFDYARKITKTINGEMYLTDAFEMLVQENRVVGYDFDGTRYDIGNKFGYLTAVVDTALRDPEYSTKLKNYLKNKIN